MLFATVYCVFFHFVCVIRCFVTSISLFFLMIRRPPRSTRTDTLVPYTTLFRSTLIVNGHNDIMVPTINSFTLQQHIPNARLILYPDSGHGSQRSEEHTSELQSLMRISYAVFCLKKKIIYTLQDDQYMKHQTHTHHRHTHTRLSNTSQNTTTNLYT